MEVRAEVEAEAFLTTQYPSVSFTRTAIYSQGHDIDSQNRGISNPRYGASNVNDSLSHESDTCHVCLKIITDTIRECRGLWICTEVQLVCILC